MTWKQYYKFENEIKTNKKSESDILNNVFVCFNLVVVVAVVVLVVVVVVLVLVVLVFLVVLVIVIVVVVVVDVAVVVVGYLSYNNGWLPSVGKGRKINLL